MVNKLKKIFAKYYDLIDILYLFPPAFVNL